MSFDIPDWGGGDCFSYYNDLLPVVPASSENSGNKLKKVKKRLKTKGDQDQEDFQAIPKKRKIDATSSSIKQNDANHTKSSLSSTRSPENKKKKEKKLKRTADNQGKELRMEDTSNTVTNSLHRSVEPLDGILLSQIPPKKKTKKNKHKQKDLNTEQKKGKKLKENALSQDAFDDSVSSTLNANASMNCELNSEILLGTATVSQQKVNESMADNKEKNQKKKRKKVKLQSIQVGNLEKCGIQSENAFKQLKVLDTEKGTHVLPDENNISMRNENGKQSKKLKKVVKKKKGVENAMNSENMKNESVNEKENDLDKPKSKVMKELVKKGKKSVEVKNKKQNQQLKDKKQKKGRNIESTEELLFDAENEDLDPRFQSDFKTLLKELDFERFHNSSTKDENINMNDSGINSALDLELEKESGLLYKKIKDNKDTFKNVEDLEDEGEEYIKYTRTKVDGISDSNKGDINPQTKNCKDILKNKEIHGAVTKKTKEKKVKKIDVKNDISEKSSTRNNEIGKKFNKEMLTRLLDEDDTTKQLQQPALSSAEALKQKMINQLAVARFRMVNEELYTSSSTTSRKVFQENPEAFTVYHTGYQAQVKRWPVNPLDLIVTWLSRKSAGLVVADFGCGEAALSLRVPQKKVYSLDLVPANSRVTACDMAHSPLASASVDVVVFCLSLMSSNIKDFIVEANRVLREGGIMKIAEVESRFGDVEQFVNLLGKFGFHCNQKDTSRTYFFLFEFKKNRKLKKTTGLPDINLKPCIYKKR